jgi:hypothetical protein
MTTENFRFYLQNRLIQTGQTGGQWYSDTSPFSIPCFIPLSLMTRPNKLERLSLETLSSHVLEFKGKARANPMERKQP